MMLAGCASITERTHAYLGTPIYPPTSPATVQILSAQPQRPVERLGEVMLSVSGKPRREKLEGKLKAAAAGLGADAAVVVSDRTHIFPIVYYGDWWGPAGVMEDMRRDIVAIAIKYR